MEQLTDHQILRAEKAISDLADILEIEKDVLVNAIDIGLNRTLLKKENIFVALYCKAKKIFQKWLKTKN